MTHLALINPLLFGPGDRLTLEEFLERWEQMPGLKFAELFDGVVYMPSPVSVEHGRRDGLMQLLLATYAARTAVCVNITNATWLMGGSAPQPDIAVRLLPEFGGMTDTSGFLAVGAPELVVEICRSSRSYDLGPKLALYQRAGVPEYLAVLIEDQRIEWRYLEGGSYRLMQPDENGVFKSRIYPGLWVDETAFWAGDSPRSLEVLEAGLLSTECRDFLKRVRS
jgi:hypothetical protein